MRKFLLVSIVSLALLGCGTAKPKLIDAGWLTGSYGQEMTIADGFMPLTVVLDTDLPIEYIKATAVAMTIYNSIIGRDVFVTPDDVDSTIAVLNTKVPMPGFVRVTMDKCLCKGGMAALYSNSDGTMAAEVVFGQASARHRFKVAIHEFGHVLGLNHDPDKNSIMYYKITSGKQDISKADRARLVSKYGKSKQKQMSVTKISMTRFVFEPNAGSYDCRQ